MVLLGLLFPLVVGVCHAAGFSAKFDNVPADAIRAAGSGARSPILNGLNFQLRFDIEVVKIGPEFRLQKVAVAKDYTFEISGLDEGEYDLSLHSYDFTLQSPRYHVVVGEGKVTAYEARLGSRQYNASSAVELTQQPLVVNVVDYKQYYQSLEGKLTEMLQSSPLGFIFKNRLYTIMFLASVVVMVGPYLLTFILPDLAEQFNDMQQSAYETKEPQNEPKLVELPAEPVPEAKARGGARARKSKR